MQSFQQALASSKHIIAVAGAGLSAASGIPTFRGAGGLWRSHDAMSLATPEGFAHDPSLVWQFYHYRREAARAAKPNAAHSALAAFSIRASIAPDATFTLITQNVDGLSPRAYRQFTIAPPSSQDEPPHLEMHGRLFDVACTSCPHVYFNTDSPICPALAGAELLTLKAESDPRIDPSQLPRCPKCGALARPGVVWFGETPQYLDQIDRLVDRADLCLVVGTSSTVYPAAGYAYAVQCNGGKVAVFNIEKSEGDEDADFLFLGPCEQTLPKALQLETIVNASH